MLLALAMGAYAHGDRIATHRGQMNDDQGEMNFELVHRARSVTIYLEDHGQPVSTHGGKASLEIKRGSMRWSTTLRPDGANRFVGRLPQSLVAGDSVSVGVSFPNGSIANGHFRLGTVPKARATTISRQPWP
ncbi:MAG: hypothetical protein H7Z15_19045 [Rhizobacter sp.]|nr:hypothetical protein [Rhizobacter sp.]